MNPILPLTEFVPDGEPRIFEYKGEKRLFLYGSRDELVTAFCGYGHDAWSAPLHDLNDWTFHGEIFSVKQVQEIGYGLVEEQTFGAPDCVYNPLTEKYYLYTFLGGLYKLDGIEGPLKDAPGTVPGFEDYGPKCVVASSDSPDGPFTDPVMCDWPALNSHGARDPAALVDINDKGSVRVFVYWGMKEGGDRCAEVNPHDMHTIIDPFTGTPDRNAWHKTLPPADEVEDSTLFEASSIRKLERNKYIFIYSANEHYPALSYCYGMTPMGPWYYGGRIIDNDENWFGGNNHGSIIDVNGQWYVFYHHKTNNSYNRQAMMEPIEIKATDKSIEIPKVEMTSQGCDMDGIEAFRKYNVSRFCYREGNAYIDGQQRQPDGRNPLIGIEGPDTITGVKYLNFGENQILISDDLSLKLNIHLLQNTFLTLQVAKPDEANEKENRVDLGSFPLQAFLPADGKYHEITLSFQKLKENGELSKLGGLKGKLAFFFSFQGGEGELCRLREFELAYKKH